MDAGEPSGDDLVRQTLDGDPAAHGALVSRHKRHIFGIASCFAAGAAELDDLYQEILLQAECPVSEIARQIGWSEPNMKVRAFHACAKLRDLLSRERIRSVLRPDQVRRFDRMVDRASNVLGATPAAPPPPGVGP